MYTAASLCDLMERLFPKIAIKKVCKAFAVIHRTALASYFKI